MQLKNVRQAIEYMKSVNPKLADLLLGYVMSDEMEIDSKIFSVLPGLTPEQIVALDVIPPEAGCAHECGETTS